jgi:hypothetical protein
LFAQLLRAILPIVEGGSMGVLAKLVALIRGDARKIERGEPRFGIPTVKFDARLITKAVKADLKANIKLLPDIDRKHHKQIYAAALRAISVGGDLGSLADALMRMNIDGMARHRAGNIARLLNRKARALITKEQQENAGIKYAEWLYSGAPCIEATSEPIAEELKQDAAHRSANRAAFEVKKGMYLNGKWTWPGRERGCKCVSKPILSGFSYTRGAHQPLAKRE